MSEFERIVKVTPAYDKRSDDPSKDYGIAACKIVFILKGSKGAIQFVIGTNWYPPHIQREQRDWQQSYERRFDKIAPEGWDVGYHSPVPIYEGQSPMGQCDVIGGQCFYDGSSLYADEWVEPFVAGGTEWLWAKMEAEYCFRFAAQIADLPPRACGGSNGSRAE